MEREPKGILSPLEHAQHTFASNPFGQRLLRLAYALGLPQDIQDTIAIVGKEPCSVQEFIKIATSSHARLQGPKGATVRNMINQTLIRTGIVINTNPSSSALLEIAVDPITVQDLEEVEEDVSKQFPQCDFHIFRTSREATKSYPIPSAPAAALLALATRKEISTSLTSDELTEICGGENIADAVVTALRKGGYVVSDGPKKLLLTQKTFDTLGCLGLLAKFISEHKR